MSWIDELEISETEYLGCFYCEMRVRDKEVMDRLHREKERQTLVSKFPAAKEINDSVCQQKKYNQQFNSHRRLIVIACPGVD